MNDYFKLFLSQEAEEFLYSLPVMARRKMMYNIRRIQEGERNKELFKKLEMLFLTLETQVNGL